MTPPPTLQELIETVQRDAGSDRPLDQLGTAAATVAELEETTDALLGHFVDRCRRDGRSWSEISGALGVTKQAVHKRFASAVAAHLVAATPYPTFERFTDRARRVVAASRQIARDLQAEDVTSAHILLGLFAEPDGIGARALAAQNVSREQIEAAVRAAAPPAAATHAAAADAAPAAGDEAATPRFSDDAKDVLRGALTVALDFGHNYIGTEHILLGIYADQRNVAAPILAAAGVPEAAARSHVTEMLRAYQQQQNQQNQQ